MPDTELTIRTRMVGDADEGLNSLRGELDGINDYASRAGETIRGTLDGVMQTFDAAQQTIQAGQSIVQHTIGSADEMRMARQQFEHIFKGVDNPAERAMRKAKTLTEEVASLNVKNAVKGMKSLGVTADGNIDKAGELIKRAKALETLNPQQGFQEAIFALKELASGQARSIADRFNMAKSAFPDRSKAKKIAERQGKELSQVYFDALDKQLQKRGGRDTLLAQQAKSARGQWQMLVTEVQGVGTEIGKIALDPVTESVESIKEDFERIRQTPKFQREVEAIGQTLAGWAESLEKVAPQLIRDLPDAVQTIQSGFEVVGSTFRTIKSFYDAHPTLVKVLAGLYAGNKLTGGLLGDMGKAIGSKAGSKIAQSGIASTLGSKMQSTLSGWTQDQLTGMLPGGGDEGGAGNCCDEISSLSESMGDSADTASDTADTTTDLADTGTDIAGATGGTAGLLNSLGIGSQTAWLGSGGALSGLSLGGAGTIAAGLAAPAMGLFGLQQFSSAKRDPTETTKAEAFRSGSEVTNAMMRQVTKGKFGKAKGSIIEALGGSPMQTFEGTQAQQMMLDEVQNRLESYGLSVSLEKGQKFKNLKFRRAGGIGHFLGTAGGLADTELSDISDMSAIDAVRGLNKAGISVDQIEINVGDVDNPQEAGQKAKEGAKEAMREAQREMVRKDKSLR
ncbi:MAG: hypothetical protein ABEN55_15485 [Bradymonadaceae bacterium]